MAMPAARKASDKSVLILMPDQSLAKRRVGFNPYCKLFAGPDFG